MTSTGTMKIRNGKGHQAYRRAQRQLRAHYQTANLPCAWCGKPFDWTITNPNDPMAFTADHTTPIAQGGPLVGQQLKGMHRRCNALKSDDTPPMIRPAT